MNISIFTSITNPEMRMDPWKEALSCYEDIADEVITVGNDWPEEFTFSYIGKVFQEGFDNSNGDWVIHMDIDNFFHEKNINDLKKVLNKYKELPTIAFPKYQIFTPDKYHIKANMCIALNKKVFPNIKLNGGGDLCQPTLNNKLLKPEDFPLVKIPIWNYDSVFKTKNVISKDRARFARAWHQEFGEWGDRGGGTEELAYAAWSEMIKTRFQNHTLRLNINDHPKYIKEKLINLSEVQFGFDLFGMRYDVSHNLIDYLKGYKLKFFN